MNEINCTDLNIKLCPNCNGGRGCSFCWANFYFKELHNMELYPLAIKNYIVSILTKEYDYSNNFECCLFYLSKVIELKFPQYKETLDKLLVLK